MATCVLRLFYYCLVSFYCIFPTVYAFQDETNIFSFYFTLLDAYQQGILGVKRYINNNIYTGFHHSSKTNISELQFGQVICIMEEKIMAITNLGNLCKVSPLFTKYFLRETFPEFDFDELVDKSPQQRVANNANNANKWSTYNFGRQLRYGFLARNLFLLRIRKEGGYRFIVHSNYLFLMRLIIRHFDHSFESVKNSTTQNEASKIENMKVLCRFLSNLSPHFEFLSRLSLHRDAKRKFELDCESIDFANIRANNNMHALSSEKEDEFLIPASPFAGELETPFSDDILETKRRESRPSFRSSRLSKDLMQVEGDETQNETQTTIGDVTQSTIRDTTRATIRDLTQGDETQASRRDATQSMKSILGMVRDTTDLVLQNIPSFHINKTFHDKVEQSRDQYANEFQIWMKNYFINSFWKENTFHKHQFAPHLSYLYAKDTLKPVFKELSLIINSPIVNEAGTSDETRIIRQLFAHFEVVNLTLFIFANLSRKTSIIDEISGPNNIFEILPSSLTSITFSNLSQKVHVDQILNKLSWCYLSILSSIRTFLDEYSSVLTPLEVSGFKKKMAVVDNYIVALLPYTSLSLAKEEKTHQEIREIIRSARMNFLTSNYHSAERCGEVKALTLVCLNELSKILMRDYVPYYDMDLERGIFVGSHKIPVRMDDKLMQYAHHVLPAYIKNLSSNLANSRPSNANTEKRRDSNTVMLRKQRSTTNKVNSPNRAANNGNTSNANHYTATANSANEANIYNAIANSANEANIYIATANSANEANIYTATANSANMTANDGYEAENSGTKSRFANIAVNPSLITNYTYESLIQSILTNPSSIQINPFHSAKHHADLAIKYNQIARQYAGSYKAHMQRANEQSTNLHFEAQQNPHNESLLKSRQDLALYYHNLSQQSYHQMQRFQEAAQSHAQYAKAYKNYYVNEKKKLTHNQMLLDCVHLLSGGVYGHSSGNMGDMLPRNNIAEMLDKCATVLNKNSEVTALAMEQHINRGVLVAHLKNASGNGNTQGDSTRNVRRLSRSRISSENDEISIENKANDANGANSANDANDANGANGASDVSGANGASDVSGANGANSANGANDRIGVDSLEEENGEEVQQVFSPFFSAFELEKDGFWAIKSPRSELANEVDEIKNNLEAALSAMGKYSDEKINLNNESNINTANNANYRNTANSANNGAGANNLNGHQDLVSELEMYTLRPPSLYNKEILFWMGLKVVANRVREYHIDSHSGANARSPPYFDSHTSANARSLPDFDSHFSANAHSFPDFDLHPSANARSSQDDDSHSSPDAHSFRDFDPDSIANVRSHRDFVSNSNANIRSGLDFDLHVEANAREYEDFDIIKRQNTFSRLLLDLKTNESVFDAFSGESLMILRHEALQYLMSYFTFLSLRIVADLIVPRDKLSPEMLHSLYIQANESASVFTT